MDLQLNFQLDFLKVLLFLIPLYIANSSAMLFGGKTPIDLGRKLKDGMPIFGNGKTFRGAIAGIFFGTLSGFLISIFYDYTSAVYSNYVLLGFLLSIGAIIGDLVASFFKRRNAIKRGSPVLLLDQLDFVFGGLVFGSIVYVPNFYEIFVICVVTLVMHKLSNYVAYRLKIKKVPW